MNLTMITGCGMLIQQHWKRFHI